MENVKENQDTGSHSLVSVTSKRGTGSVKGKDSYRGGGTGLTSGEGIRGSSHGQED